MCACVLHGSVLLLIVTALLSTNIAEHIHAQEAEDYPSDREDISRATDGEEQEDRRLAVLQSELEEQLKLEQGGGAIPGQPVQDYPVYSQIPHTSFTCADKHAPGYYADVETHCQVFHVCAASGAHHSFLCPSGSVFNQRYLVCDWWYSSYCEDAPQLFSDQHILHESARLHQPDLVDLSNQEQVFATDQNNYFIPQNEIFHSAETGVPNRERFESLNKNNTF